MNLTDINQIKDLLNRHGFRFSKSLGQNFLCAAWVPEDIADSAEIDGETGVLEVGKKADIIALDLSKPHLYPNFDTVSLITCSAQASDVCMTMVDGRILYENGVFLTLDEEKVRADMKAAVTRLYK